MGIVNDVQGEKVRPGPSSKSASKSRQTLKINSFHPLASIPDLLIVSLNLLVVSPDHYVDNN